MVSAISIQSYEKLLETNAILTPMKAIHMELEAANKSDMSVHGICNLGFVCSWTSHSYLTWSVALCQAEDTNPYNFTVSKRATECFAETTDSVCIPPHSEVMLWAKLKTNNGRKGPTAGVVLALQSFVQEFGLLVGRSLVRADVDDWKVPILIYNSDLCRMQPADCLCNPVMVPAHTRIARVEEIQAIQHIGSRNTETHTKEAHYHHT